MLAVLFSSCSGVSGASSSNLQPASSPGGAIPSASPLAPSATPSPAPGRTAQPTPNPTPQPSPSPAPQASRYLYLGVFTDQGGVQGFRVDPTGGTLSEVPGSPLLFGGPVTNQYAQGGSVAVANRHLYVGYGPPNLQPPVIRSYAIDAVTGSLGTPTETDAGSLGTDRQMRSLVTDPGGHNLYVVYQNSIASFQINNDGSLTPLGSTGNLAIAFVFSLAISPKANIALLGVDNCPPKGLCTGPPDILLLNRDPQTGALSNSHKAIGQNSVWSPGVLAFSPSGDQLLAWTIDANGNSQIGVYNVDYSNNTLAPATGSPYSIDGGLSPNAFGFDASGDFLYVLNSSPAQPQPESVSVYSFDRQTGGLLGLQNQSLPAGNFPAALLVDEDFIYVFNSQAGSTPSVIYVLPRDPATGRVSSPTHTQTDTVGGLGEAVEIQL